MSPFRHLQKSQSDVAAASDFLMGKERSPGGRPPTPVFWPGESHGQRSLAGYSPRGRKELDMTEQLSTAQHVKKASFDPGLEDDNTS